MGCEPMTDKDGQVVGFRCGRGRRTPPLCRYCNRQSTKLCDGPGTNPSAPMDDLRPGVRTCDVPLCDQHAHPGGTNVDYCEAHKALAGNVVKLREANRHDP